MIRNKKFLVGISFFILIFLSAFNYPQESPTDITVEDIMDLLNDPSVIDKTLSGIFNDPENIETINKIWKENVVKENRFLKDLNLEFKTFKVKDSEYGLGIGYSFSTDITRRRMENKSQMGISLSIHSTGNIAFEKNINPEDFLVSGLSFHVFKSIGGAITASPGVWTKLNELELSLAMIEDSTELVNSPLLDEFIAISKKYLEDQIYIDFSVNAEYESNQDFSNKQYLFGASLGVDYKLWKNELFNVFDYPFAALRWLSGYDIELSPIGASFPTLIVSFESVDPVQNRIREDLNVLDNYFRLSGEISFKTPLSARSFFEASLRYFKEINAPDEIIMSGLGESIFFKAALVTNGGVFISYSNGRLPFDSEDNEIYQLGFNYNF